MMPRRTTSVRTRTRKRPEGVSPIVLVGLVYSWVLLGLTLVHSLAPQRTGLLALTQILAPYLFVVSVLLFPFALRRGVGVAFLRISLALCTLVGIVRFFPRSGRAAQVPADRSSITVMTWNVRVSNSLTERFRQHVVSYAADVVALQECDWQPVYESTELAQQYPYQLVHPGDRVPPGIALLSVFPIQEYGVLEEPAEVWDIPRALWVRLDVGQEYPLVVIVAHPRPPLTFNRGCGVFCSAQRDQQIAAIGRLAVSFVEQGHPVLLVGDMNVTEREPAYADLQTPLLDAHVQVGRGWGHTWRLGGLPLLRIDYLLASPDIVPVWIKADCSAPESDHCSLVGQFALPVDR